MKWLTRAGGLLVLIGLTKKAYRNREALKASGKYVKEAVQHKLSRSPISFRKRRSTH